MHVTTSTLLTGVAASVVAAALVTVIVTSFLTKRRRADYELLQFIASSKALQDVLSSYFVPPRDDLGIGKLMRAALADDRRKTFWSSILVAFAINCVTNFMFFILGIIVTMHTTNPR